MSSCGEIFCVKCDEKIGDSSDDKIIKCFGNCKACLHYNCSSYNTSQLQFLESNRNNIKWICDGCCGHFDN